MDGQCELCGLSKTRHNIVVGRGEPSAKVWFIGEAPGRQEDEQGYPFVGAAGKELNRALEFLGLGQGKYWITNTVRCRPIDEIGNNRAPTDEEKHICGKYLLDDLERYSPQYIVALGKHSATFLVGELEGGMYRNVGKTFAYRNSTVFISIHPAAILYKPPLRKMWDDSLEKLRGLLNP